MIVDQFYITEITRETKGHNYNEAETFTGFCLIGFTICYAETEIQSVMRTHTFVDSFSGAYMMVKDFLNNMDL